MAHGGTNFGFYNGANTGDNVLDYKPDLTSYDYVRMTLIFLYLFLSTYFFLLLISRIVKRIYLAVPDLFQDAPIKESGDIDNAKYEGQFLQCLHLFPFFFVFFSMN